MSELARHYAALTEYAGVLPCPRRTVLELTGADRKQFLHNLCTNDIVKLSEGSGCEAFVTNVQGKTIGHVFVYCEAERLVVETVTDQADRLLGHLDYYLIREDVQMTDCSASYGHLVLCGLAAPDVLRSLWDRTPEALFDHHRHSETTIARVPLGYPPCFLLRAPVDDVVPLQSQLVERGAVETASAAFEAVRIETGFPWFGVDVTDANLPQETGRVALAVSFTKGCYLGQETVARIDALGHVNRQMACVRFQDGSMPPRKMPLFHADKVVGHITSAALLPLLDATIALAILRREVCSAGTQLDSDIGPAGVVPFKC
jgi:folate-binding protein YgfZ